MRYVKFDSFKEFEAWHDEVNEEFNLPKTGTMRKFGNKTKIVGRTLQYTQPYIHPNGVQVIAYVKDDFLDTHKIDTLSREEAQRLGWFNDDAI